MPRSEERLRSLVRRELSGLELGLPLNALELCDAYGARRGRPIQCQAHPLPSGTPNGVWLIAADRDHFFYQANTTAVHRDQILIHELGHLIAGHQVLDPTQIGTAAAADTGAALHRTCYDDEREWEAERIATYIAGWADEAFGGSGRTNQEPAVRGLQRILGGHAGWL